MTPRAATLLVALACLPGCGTAMNLQAPPNRTSAVHSLGPTACEPFGGVGRDVAAWEWSFFGVGDGGLLGVPVVLAASAYALVDAPLSLVGDALTLPVVYARQRGQAWASWGLDVDPPRTPSYPPPAI